MEWWIKVVGMDRLPVSGGTGRYPPLGEWTKTRKVTLCHSGWHVTNPTYLRNWESSATRVFICQCDGIAVSDDGDEGGKKAFGRMRLLYEVTKQDIAIVCGFSNNEAIQELKALGLFSKKFFEELAVDGSIAHEIAEAAGVRNTEPANFDDLADSLAYGDSVESAEEVQKRFASLIGKRLRAAGYHGRHYPGVI